SYYISSVAEFRCDLREQRMLFLIPSSRITSSYAGVIIITIQNALFYGISSIVDVSFCLGFLFFYGHNYSTFVYQVSPLLNLAETSTLMLHCFLKNSSSF